jgi:hypothetical protein
VRPGKLWARYYCASNGGAIFKPAWLVENGVQHMAAGSNSGKDTLKVEKTSLLILGLCIVVLVCLLVFRPF